MTAKVESEFRQSSNVATTFYYSLFPGLTTVTSKTMEQVLCTHLQGVLQDWEMKGIFWANSYGIC